MAVETSCYWSKGSFQVFVQGSCQRIFTDKEYRAAGAIITDDLSEASLILGVKQVPIENLFPGKYVYLLDEPI